MGGYTRTNVDQSYRAGLELEAGYNILSNLSITGNIALSQNKIKAFNEFVDNYDVGGQDTIAHTNTDLAFSPNIISSLALNYEPVKGLNLTFTSKYVGDQFLDNTSTETRKLDADPGDKSMGEDFQVAFTYIMSIRKPIIVALNGACAGLGMSIALLCDMRFSSENGKFVTAFAQRGLIAEHGQSWILPRLIGSARALDLLWSSRKVGADEAMQMGLVNRIIPQDELLHETKAYIQNLADNCSPTSLMMMKQQVYRHMNAPLGEAMKVSNKWMAESLKREDFKEGVASYLEKRAPDFNKIKM